MIWKFILLLTLTTSLDAEKNINLFLGRWLPTATYPKMATFPLCVWFDLILQPDNVTCKCGGEDVQALEFKVLNHDTDTGEKEIVPVIMIESSSEVAQALKTKCTCDNTSKQHIVLRYINGKYFVYYVLLPGTEYTDKDPYTAVLTTKNYVTTKELDLAESQIDDLKGRERAYLCDPINYEYYLLHKEKNSASQKFV